MGIKLKLNKIILLSIFLLAVLTLGAASASENSTDNLKIDGAVDVSASVDEDIVADDEPGQPKDVEITFPDSIKACERFNVNITLPEEASGEVYYRSGRYDLAEKAIRRQGEMIGRAMEIGEPIDLRMDLDEQFRILLLQAELRKRKDKNGWAVALAYGGCEWMICYIHDCVEKRGFHLLSRITSADERYVHEQLIQCGQEKKIAPTANDQQSDKFYTAMYL